MSTAMPAAVISLTQELSLRPVTVSLGATLGAAIAGMEPWSVLDYPPQRMIDFLTANDPALSRMAVFFGDTPAGIIAVRSPWLRGPYLQLLAVLPAFQGLGVGAALLDWYERSAGPGSRWLWLCCSSFNTRAAAFYVRHGFEAVTTLPDLVTDGGDEVLMRKRINPPA